MEHVKILHNSGPTQLIEAMPLMELISTAVTLDQTLGLSCEQDRKIHIPIAKQKERWALKDPSATALGHRDSPCILSSVGESH